MIYQSLLGNQFEQLHPKLQHRYTMPFYAKGIMHEIQTGSALLQPVYQFGKHMNFLFPESGKNIPFTLKNTWDGESTVRFERTFYFPTATRTFTTAMHVNLANRTARDYLGDPAIVSADLEFSITKDGSLITKSGAQKIVAGPAEIPLFSFLEGRGSAVESYDEQKQLYTIEIATYNALVGKIVSYIGEFEETELF